MVFIDVLFNEINFYIVGNGKSELGTYRIQILFFFNSVMKVLASISWHNKLSFK